MNLMLRDLGLEFHQLGVCLSYGQRGLLDFRMASLNTALDVGNLLFDLGLLFGRIFDILLQFVDPGRQKANFDLRSLDPLDPLRILDSIVSIRLPVKGLRILQSHHPRPSSGPGRQE